MNIVNVVDYPCSECCCDDQSEHELDCTGAVATLWNREGSLEAFSVVLNWFTTVDSSLLSTGIAGVNDSEGSGMEFKVHPG